MSRRPIIAVSALAAALALVVGAWWMSKPPPVPVPSFVPPEGPALPFDQTGDAGSLQLHLLPGSYVLPERSAPEGTNWDEAFEVDRFVSAQVGPRGLTQQVIDLPLRRTHSRARFAWSALEVKLDGVEVPRAGRAGPRDGTTSWTVAAGQLVVHSPGPLKPAQLTLQMRDFEARLGQLERERFDGTDAEFVPFTHAIGDRARQGLLLPAPATASFDVTLPDGAWFEGWTAMVPSPVLGRLSDGATAVLSVTANGTTTEVTRQPIDVDGGFLSVLSEEAFTPWAADLSAWSGQAVTVTITTEPGASSDYDYVFVGSPVISGQPTAPVRRVVVIAVDTLRPDHLGTYGYEREGISPEIDAFAADSTVFEQSFAPAPRTRPSFRTATTGRRPLDAVGAVNIGEVFQANGFATAGIVANVHLNPRFDFNQGFDDWWLDPLAKANDQVDRSLAWLERNQHRDSFLFMHIMDPHLLYIAPQELQDRFVREADPSLPSEFNRWMVLDWQRNGELTDTRKQHIEDLYDAEIAWTSTQVGRFMDGLAALGDNTLVVFHTDHGEEFWEHDGFEHNHTLYNDVVRTALWVRPPGKKPAAPRSAEPVWLADIAPTLFDYAGFSSTPPTDGRSLRPLIDGSDKGGWDRDIPIGHLMYDKERWAVVSGGEKYIVQTTLGREELYDLAADPGETKSKSTSGRADLWEALGRAHGMTVGPGWRIQLMSMRPSELTLELPQPALAAGVFDPEADLVHRANQAWGETARYTPDDIATVALSADGTELTIRKGPRARGYLWVRFAQPTSVDVTIRHNAEVLGTVKGDRRRWIHKGNNLFFFPGPVFDTPPGEVVRMGLTSDAESEETCELCALGYLHGAACESCDEPESTGDKGEPGAETDEP